ncbi:penicillin-binding protein 2 [Sphingomonas arantia]|uniref:Penicillin-binding protein 2 n=1 Tax=Sphingomonas arantia TaxID=1460676 RepID=A0ABW4TXN3_9SPHN
MRWRRTQQRTPTTEHAQALSFTRRALVLGGVQGGIMAMLAVRMGWLSIAENEHYRLLSESNRVQLQLIPPRRGWIVDRNGRPMAINRTDFRVDLIPDQLRDRDRVLAALQRMLGLTPDDMQRITEELEDSPGFRPVPVAENLPYEKFAAVSVRLPDMAGVAPAQGYSRYYPDGAAIAHLIGYVGAASAKDYERDRNPLLITPGFKIGKEGLERSMEPLLRGLPGAKRNEVTARGKLVRELTTRPDTNGRTLKLTIDAGLQAYAARRLGNESGAVVVVDTHTGDLLTMTSMPAYDPNSFTDGISHAEWDMLSQDDHLPLLNKTLQGLYPPGSTVKPIAALALQEAGVSPAERVFCSGSYRLGNGTFHCHKRGGHGPLDMYGAIAQSCDVYFFTMGRRIGIDRIATMARKLGLGSEYPLPFKSQSYGTVPDTAWKLKKYDKDWTVADTLNATIGQGYMLANPLQLAMMVARIASGRALMPALTPGARRGAAPLQIDPEHLAVVRQAMSNVINHGGTAGRSKLPIPGIEMAGKTGTAQVRRITKADRARGGKFGGAGTDWKYRDHGLFVAFAPVAAPRYAVAVVLEHGISGSGAAGPVARDVMTYIYDKPRAEKILAVLEEGWGGDIATRAATHAAEWRAARAAKEAPPSTPAPPPPPPGPVE